MKRALEHLSWFVAGFALAAVLSVSYEAVRYVPMAIAFGLLCFGCGLLLFLYLNLQRQSEEYFTTAMDSVKRQLADEAELSKKKQEFETEKALWKVLHGEDEQT